MPAQEQPPPQQPHDQIIDLLISIRDKLDDLLTGVAATKGTSTRNSARLLAVEAALRNTPGSGAALPSVDPQFLDACLLPPGVDTDVLVNVNAREVIVTVEGGTDADLAWRALHDRVPPLPERRTG